MRYVIQQKLFTWGDHFTIRDAEGRDVFRVDGKAFPVVRRQLSFRDMDGRELALLRQKMLSWSGRTYEIWRDGILAAIVKKELFTLVHCRFTVDVPGPDDLEAKGDFWEREFTFSRGERPVATVSKRWTWTDTYGVEVVDGEDAVLILASTVVIGMARRANRK